MWELSQGATLIILAQLHRLLALPFLKILGPLFLIFLLFILKKLLNQNNVEFDFSIGYALALFAFILIINKKCKVIHVRLPCHPQKFIYIDIFWP